MEEFNDDPDLTLKDVLADMPARHVLRGIIAISGRYSCEYCKGKARSGSGISWPYPRYFGCPSREHQEMEGIARYSVQFPQDLSCKVKRAFPFRLGLGLECEEERQGILEFSPLFDLQSCFDIVWDVNVDPFHLLFEGITKECMRRMFTAEKTKVSRSFHRLLSRLYENTKVFSETPKRTRAIVSSTLKGHEYGLLTFSVLLPFALDTMRNVSAGEW